MILQMPPGPSAQMVSRQPTAAHSRRLRATTDPQPLAYLGPWIAASSLSSRRPGSHTRRNFIQPTFRTARRLLSLQRLDERFQSTQVVGQESKSRVQVLNFALTGPFALLKLPLNRGNPPVQTANKRRHLARGFLSCLGLHIYTLWKHSFKQPAQTDK
jgi:hypothetical protein